MATNVVLVPVLVLVVGVVVITSALAMQAMV